MKSSSLLLALPVLAAGIVARAQETPPAAPAPAPAAEAPAFPDEKTRRSYALGNFLANREKSVAASAGTAQRMNLPDVVRGLEDVLSGKVALDYVAGAQMGMQIRKAGMEIDAAALVQGLSDIMENKVPKLQPAETQALMQQIQAELMKKAEEKRQADLKQALVDAEAYLEKNAAAPGVTRTPSGLQHAIEKPGEGRTPEDMDIITVNIRGTLADGTEFEKNNEGVPVRKSMRAVCQGLQEGLKLLKPGGKARFVIPPALGFGEAGRPPVVKGNAVLIYEVELINAEPRPPQAAADPNAPKKEPITAVTPPVAVEIPAQPGAAPAAPPVPAPAPGSPPPQKP